jgi:hypothetical protein
MERFSFDERGYLQWVQANQHGLVLNAGRSTDHTTDKLHRATCGTISGTPTRRGGEFYPETPWTGKRLKVCSLDKDELLRWARQNHKGNESMKGTLTVS